jgi:hypothetical protein
MAQDISALAKRLLAELDTIKDIADTDERAAAFRAYQKKLSAAYTGASAAASRAFKTEMSAAFGKGEK